MVARGRACAFACVLVTVRVCKSSFACACVCTVTDVRVSEIEESWSVSHVLQCVCVHAFACN